MNKIYENVNNGVYKCGFSTSQKGYDEAISNLFKTLHDLNLRLSNSRFLLGSKLFSFILCNFNLLIYKF